MLGTVINLAAVCLGTAAGMLFGNRFSEKLRNTIMAALGIFVILTGIDLFLKTSNSIIPLAGLVIGSCIGEALKIEERMEGLGGRIQDWFAKRTGGSSSSERETFIRAFLTVSLLYCIGPMAVLGSIQDGLGNGCQILLIKSILDGVTAIAFASAMGIGVAFSCVPLLVYQGGITLLASGASALLSDAMITEMSAAGGVMLIAIALSGMMEIKKIRVSSMLPALIITPLLLKIIELF